MFLSSFLGAPSGRRGSIISSKSKSSRHSPEVSPSRPQDSDASSSPEYLSDESQLQFAAPTPQDVLDLNNNLEMLAALFPDVQVEVFREMLSSFSEESRLFIITDKLLKNPGLYVKGRRRTSDGTSSDTNALVPRTEAFRTIEYKKAVRALAMQEFKGLSRSSIDAVLSESNYSYLDARPTLVDLSSKSWKFTISSMFFRRKPVTSTEAETHPLIIWRASDDGSLIPTLKATGSAELDRELFEELIVPLKQREQLSRETSDRALAISLLTEEAEAMEATYECNCCYSDVIFEELTTCDAEGHLICYRCVQHSITEAIFGQGWQRSIDKETGSLRCPAVASTECAGCISSEHIHRAMREEKNGDEIIRKLDQRLAEYGLLSSGLPLIRCPFCTYAEVDELYIPANSRRPKIRASNLVNLIIVFICLVLSPFYFPILTLVIGYAMLCLNGSFRGYVSYHLGAAISRYQRRRRGLKFTCQNPVCARSSCLSCSKAWMDIHICHESSLVALRTQVELAMSMAIKRVCPRCNTSFVKTAGCNKLTCPCGYKMCYVCRKDIGPATEGYAHFCQHFRPEGDGRRCKECNKCNLWESENTEEILREAKAEAEKRWRESERRELSDAEKAYLEDDVGTIGQKGQMTKGLRQLLPGGKIPSIEEFFDFIIESLFV
ncbi:uncharacterized protein GGS22DRAFT_152928 [Annulohypoxylon maeteangense]|uniref:uncharacterized protein n=1 Tax=Annulohypoxylon maeteangense TaxID=1927788 RepID=UPI0020085706|nr:uncharacterized protein GGS22DRAFT_152928 [Annulohypoxylon maeteangense]KAI0889023.1 hypothetical protein GGS22DRAFT_152928 [Annulohypoxylon maeteangense]